MSGIPPTKETLSAIEELVAAAKKFVWCSYGTPCPTCERLRDAIEHVEALLR